MASVRQRVLTGASLVAAVLLFFFLNSIAAPGLVPWCLAFLLLGLSVFELGAMGALGGPPLRRVLIPVAGAVALLAGLVLYLDLSGRLASGGLGLLATYAAAYAAALLGLAWPARRGEPARGARGGAAVGLALWVAPPFALLVLFEREYGPFALGAVILLAKVGDIFGYFVGRAIGERHPFPNISPNKTVAGCVASAVAAMVAGPFALMLAGLSPPGGRLLAGAIVGLLLNLAAQAGDLLESAVKRRAGVKDSSPLVGASGGVLDVVDSLLLVAPVAALFWPLLLGRV